LARFFRAIALHEACAYPTVMRASALRNASSDLATDTIRSRIAGDETCLRVESQVRRRRKVVTLKSPDRVSAAKIIAAK
jgi:hypothetical protein